MSELKMPSFGADMEAGTLTEWLIKPGDQVKRNDVIAVIETQKGAIDMEVFSSGTVTALLLNEGDSAPVGAPIALIDDGMASSIAGAADEEEEGIGETELEQDITSLKAISLGETVLPTSTQPQQYLKPKGTRVLASPLARRLAVQQGLDINSVTGSGPRGEILGRDLNLKQQHKSSSSGLNIDEMRRAIAAAMSRSKKEIPHYYLEHSIDLQKSVQWLAEYNRNKPAEQQVLLNALLHLAVAKALHKSPELNGFYSDDKFQPAEAINLGTAISIRGGGLIAPAIIDADKLSLSEMMSKLMDLSLRVREGGLRSSEMSQGTVTLSSMGDRGVEKVFGVIYPPQVALIGLGKPEEKPLVVDGQVEVKIQVVATLAADHRVSDGRQGAKFLRNLDKLLQKPERL